MKKILNCSLPLLALILISGCATGPTTPVTRYAWVSGLKPDKIEHYEYLHSHPDTQRWWKDTDPCQAPLPEAAARGKLWSDAKDVFHQP